MTIATTRLCNRCGRSLRDTEIPLGLCGHCLINPTVPLPVAMTAATPEAGDGQHPDQPGTTYRHRPLRHCACGIALKPRMRYCDQCRLRRRRETGRTRINRFRQQRTAVQPTQCFERPRRAIPCGLQRCQGEKWHLVRRRVKSLQDASWEDAAA
jgi:hypothetical protein